MRISDWISDVCSSDLPFLVMPAAAALVWKWLMLDSNVGMVNWSLGLFGIEPVQWNTNFPLVTIVMVLVWQYTPFMMLILMAGLQSQGTDVLEAAAVDRSEDRRVGKECGRKWIS